MSNLNLCRLWYIFPPDDQELKPHEFERKVTSFLHTLSLNHKLAVLDFLAVQYAAFQHQLEVMLARTVLSRAEHSERCEKLRYHVRTLHACRRAVELSSRVERVGTARPGPPAFSGDRMGGKVTSKAARIAADGLMKRVD